MRLDANSPFHFVQRLFRAGLESSPGDYPRPAGRSSFQLSGRLLRCRSRSSQNRFRLIPVSVLRAEPGVRAFLVKLHGRGGGLGDSRGNSFDGHLKLLWLS